MRSTFWRDVWESFAGTHERRQTQRTLAALNDHVEQTIPALKAERDALRQLVHDLWAAWNDDTAVLHSQLVDHMAADDLPGLDLSPKQQTLLEETIRWVHNWTAEQLGDGRNT